MPVSRLWGFGLIVCVVAFGFGIRLLDLQILKGEEYALLGQGNSLRSQKISAPRGTIRDRNGIILAENRPNFVLRVQLSQIHDFSGALRTLSFLLEKPVEDFQEKIIGGRRWSPLVPVSVAKGLDEGEVARIRGKISQIQTEGLKEFPLDGIRLELQYERSYPGGATMGHLLGYVREAGPKQVQGRVGPGDSVGIKGVEKAFDDLLRGYDGVDYAVVNARGKEVDLNYLGLEQWFHDEAPRAGQDLTLSVDSRLNQIAYEAFGERVGALVALNPQNGEILAWVSKPSYDPEDLSGVIPTKVWAEHRDHPDNILLNRPIQGAYPPGSTHKIVTALAALAEGKITLDEKITCHGHYRYGGRNWGCWNRRGHGALNLAQALKQSCDVFFYKLGERLGPDRLAYYGRLLGLGAKTDVLTDYERSGLIPTREWKLKKYKTPWKNSDSLGNAIGQGYNLVTPLQNALMVARFANGGKAIQPKLLRDSKDVPAKKLPWKINAKQFAFLKESLVQVVEGPGGTGKNARVPGIHVGGKTGTAQVVGLQHKGKAKGKSEDHAWFVAFAPAEKPEIALAVLVEHGGGGGAVAAPIAQKVLAAYFGK